ncbi:hypothetical protein DFP72DRAFT_1175583 [Ephemerocybe angulata]|uniref:Uncharacterized protein n=1 Tax=Ephemerocybe angulata TaxID=980116 RepID=A0A8H6LZ70_9AGAR|nr:hypothetical protein DFP72DRAFT_1175583 [Tulosesus angulatus]
MRVPLFTLLSCALSLASHIAAYGDHSLEAREAIDAVLAERGLYENDLSVRELLADVSTRELIGELSERLERRANDCLECGKSFNLPKERYMPRKFYASFAKSTFLDQRSLNT